MPVAEVLDKITERNAPVVGCIARKDGRIFHNLDGFDVDFGRIADTMEDLLSVSDFLDDGSAKIDTVFTEYDGNCLIGQRIDDSVLVTVTDHVERAGFKKLQVGLSLQSRLLKKALDEAADEPEPIAEPVAAEPIEAEPAAKPNESSKSAWSKLLNAVVASTPEETAAPAQDDAAIAGKKRKVYRGQVYYE